MYQNSRRIRSHHEGLLSAVSIGFFLILIGVLFISTPNLSNSVTNFFSHFTSQQVRNTGIYIPIPQNVESYGDIYLTVRQFDLIWGLFLVGLLGARLVLGSPIRKLAENVGDITFWLGAAYVTETFLVASTVDTLRWFEFWTSIIMLIGVSLIARGIFLAAAKLRRY